MKTGFIAILGMPNAGKSTLINALLKKKIAIATHKAQTTRNAILGIYNDEDYQIVFVDTPGIHEATTALGTFMNKEAMSQADGADVIFYIVDGNKGISKNDKDILNKVFKYDAPVFLLVNKIDEMSQSNIIKKLTQATSEYDFAEIIPISALNSTNLDDLLNTAKTYLKDEIQYFPNDVDTNVDINFKIAEIIREKIILNTEKEVPHLVACKIDKLEEKTSKVFIEASIICNKESHKAIIIGKNGNMLKKINSQASSDIAKLFDGKRIYLSLFVRVKEDWINSSKSLFDLGYFIEK